METQSSLKTPYERKQTVIGGLLHTELIMRSFFGFLCCNLMKLLYQQASYEPFQTTYEIFLPVKALVYIVLPTLAKQEKHSKHMM